MTVLFYNHNSCMTLTVVGVTCCCETDRIKDMPFYTIDSIDLSSRIWLCEHKGMTCFEPDTTISFALNAEIWDVLGMYASDSTFALTAQYVIMDNGIQISDDLKRKEVKNGENIS